MLFFLTHSTYLHSKIVILIVLSFFCSINIPIDLHSKIVILIECCQVL